MLQKYINAAAAIKADSSHKKAYAIGIADGILTAFVIVTVVVVLTGVFS